MKTMETTSERITIAVGGAAMPAYVAKPEGRGAWPGVLLFMEIFGINAHIRSVADRIAAEGYVVLAPDLFHRTAPGVELGYDDPSLQKGIGLMSQVKASEALADVRAALDTIRGRDDVAGRGVGAIGFCFGGHIAYLAACELPIAATASFYGGGIAQGAPGNDGPPTVERSAKIGGRILCLFGTEDTYIPADDVAKIREALKVAGVDHEVVVYEGVGHGFFCDARPDYDEKSASDAWKRVKTLFAETLA
jgi:carboxymethylenebutenolidase